METSEVVRSINCCRWQLHASLMIQWLRVNFNIVNIFVALLAAVSILNMVTVYRLDFVFGTSIWRCFAISKLNCFERTAILQYRLDHLLTNSFFCLPAMFVLSGYALGPGEIPASLGRLTNLSGLDLGKNKLEGKSWSHVAALARYTCILFLFSWVSMMRQVERRRWCDPLGISVLSAMLLFSFFDQPIISLVLWKYFVLLLFTSFRGDSWESGPTHKAQCPLSLE